MSEDQLPLLSEFAMTPAERRRMQIQAKRSSPVPRGHVRPPGTGPKGETCKTCKHLYRNRQAKTYLKCGLARARWTGGGATDIRAGDPACERWEANATPPPASVRT